MSKRMLTSEQIAWVSYISDYIAYDSINNAIVIEKIRCEGFECANTAIAQDFKISENVTLSMVDSNLTALDNLVTTLLMTVSTDATAGDKSVSPINNLDQRFTYNSGIASLTLNAYTGTLLNLDLTFSITFKSGTTPTTITNTLGVYFTGDATSSGVFTPVASKQYDLVIWYDGFGWQGVVRGK